jgi:hypothetical protein
MTLPTRQRHLRAICERNLDHGRGKRRKAVPRRLYLELLEDRTLPATAVTILESDPITAGGLLSQ